MSTTLAPASLTELVEVVRSCPRLLAFGMGTKPRLSDVNATRISVARLRGIVQYEPGEFTFTAKAGTPLRELAETLAAQGQYLPFDPFLLNSGATLGGTVAAGLSGPGRLRFGGLRDFILGAQFVDGLGRALRVGGRVVKNAAGFDLPKFFVGSLGRFGVLAELTFKVFPAAPASVTLRLTAADPEAAARILVEATSARWELQAADMPTGSYDVFVRLAGPAQALRQMSADILARWPGEPLSDLEAQRLWSDLNEFRWAYPEGPLIKVVLTPADLAVLCRGLQSLEGSRIHVSGGGNMSFVSLPTASRLEVLDELLHKLSLPGLTLRGAAPLWWGRQPRTRIAQAVKDALDPQKRFPDLDE
jgi:glycolate oxidase FAD binding subunit